VLSCVEITGLDTTGEGFLLVGIQKRDFVDLLEIGL